MKKRLLKYIVPCIFLTLLLSSCESLLSYNINVEVGREAPKEETIIYVQASTSDVFGEGSSDSLSQLIIQHGIESQVVNDISSIPTYETEYYSGTCFSIAPHYVITNSHVINYGTYNSIKIYIDNVGYNAEIIFNDNELDFAVLYLPDFVFPYSFDLNANPEYKLAKQVYAIGYPIADILNLDPRVTQGIINAKSGFDGNPDEVQISAEIQPGNSGGPLLYTSDLTNVIGINSSSISDIASLATKGTVMQNVNFAIKSSAIIKSFPLIKEIDSEENAYPIDLEQAAEATAYVMTEYKPISPYTKRLVISSTTDTTQTLNLTGYGAWYSYRTLLNMRFFDVDSGVLDSWIVGNYNGQNLKSILLMGFEDYCNNVYGDEDIL